MGLKLNLARNLPMHHKTIKTWIAHPRPRRLVYRIVNHQEAGIFDSMTGANIWALNHVNDWDWTVEPAPGGPPI